jgi:hypothetical protein
VLSGAVLPGMVLTLNGEPVALAPNNTFAVTVTLRQGTNNFRFEVSVPVWGNTEPMRFPLQIKLRN